jgi:SAM-dependent methyltransferase
MTNTYLTWKDWQNSEFGRCEIEDGLYFSQELGACGIAAIAGLKIGELGFGNGIFAGWVRKAGGHWVGKEVIPELKRRAEEAGFDTVGPDADFSKAWGPEKLDLMVAFDVVEHLDLDAVRTFLREAKEALRPGGLLLLRYPNGDSPFSGAIYRGDLTHQTLLGSGAARQLGLESGLEVFQVRSPVLPIWGLGPVRALRRIAVRLMQGVAFAFVRNVLMGHKGAVLSPNLIVVFRKNGDAR